MPGGMVAFSIFGVTLKRLHQGLLALLAVALAVRVAAWLITPTIPALLLLLILVTVLQFMLSIRRP